MFSKYWFGDELSTYILFGEIVFAGVVVVLVATRLTHVADRFADEWRLGKAFVGMLLLATVTSLPEVVAGAASGAIGAVDLAFGAVYGSCSFNIVIIVIMNLVLAGGGSVLGRGDLGKRNAQLLSSSFGIVMISLSLLAIATVDKFTGRPLIQQVAEVGTCVMIVGVYVFCMNLTRRYGRRDLLQDAGSDAPPRSLATLARVLAISALVILAAWWLTKTGDVLAEHPIGLLGRPLGATVVGTYFLAVATSLPEIATSVAAVRMNNLDMALGNVFGSNMFNILVLPVVKIATLLHGFPLMMANERFTAESNLLTGMLCILLTAIAVGGIAYSTKRRVLKLGFDSVLLLVTYIVGVVLVVW